MRRSSSYRPARLVALARGGAETEALRFLRDLPDLLASLIALQEIYRVQYGHLAAFESSVANIATYRKMIDGALNLKQPATVKRQIVLTPFSQIIQQLKLWARQQKQV